MPFGITHLYSLALTLPPDLCERAASSERRHLASQKWTLRYSRHSVPRKSVVRAGASHLSAQGLFASAALLRVDRVGLSVVARIFDFNLVAHLTQPAGCERRHH